MSRPKPALRAELLFYLTFLVAFALLVGVATSLLTLAMAPESGVVIIIVLIAVEVGIFVLYGRSLVSRLVLRPLDRVVATADAVADGDPYHDDEDLFDLCRVDVAGACQQGRRAEVRVRFRA